ncbi:Ras-related protein Rap-2c [Lemmus lemmus]
MREYKVVVLGSGGVGKSALTVQFVTGTFIEKYDPTIEDRYEKVPLILVGNKVDLEAEREVMSSEGRALAQEWGCPFMETSAKSKSMVDELFAEIVRQMNYSSLPEKQDQCCTTCVVQ